MLSLILTAIHALIGISIFISAWLPVPLKYKIFSFYLTLLAMASWIIFGKCIVWEIQRKVVKDFNPQKDSIAGRFNINPRIYGFILTTLNYINLYMLGKQIDVRIPTINMIILYLMINQRFLLRNGY
jgi:hypothetical protein